MKRKNDSKRTVRLTGGSCSGRVIDTPGGATHPMGERERLALFNMLGDRIAGARVLDIYAGGGTLGFEALSRGAKEAVFVEKKPEACATIRKNAETLGLTERSKVIHSSAETFLEENTLKYDIVLADPPYDNFTKETIQKSGKLLADDGILVLSHPGEPPEINGLNLVKSRKYAGACISLYDILAFLAKV